MLTDIKTLVFYLPRARDAWSACQGCHPAYVAEFTSVLRQVAGEDNVVVDFCGHVCGPLWHALRPHY